MNPKEAKEAKEAKDMKTIVIIGSDNPILEYTCRQLEKGYQLLGHPVFYTYIEQILSDPTELLQCALQGIQRVLLLNNRGLLLKVEGEYLWDKLHVPCVNYILDHPYFYFDTCNINPKYGILACVDREHVAYAKRFYPHIRYPIFLPLAGEETAGEKQVWQNREIDVLYVGAYKHRSDFKTDEISEELICCLFENTGWTLEYAVEHYCKEHHQKMEDDELKLFIEEYRMIDIYMKFHYRSAVVRKLIQAGIHVTVYGDGWEKSDLMQNEYFHYKGQISQNECIQQMQNSKIVLNIMPWFKDGIHDRIINAMLAGAVCVTDGSKYLKEQFTAGADYIEFSLDRLNELPDILHHILRDHEDAEKIAKKPLNKVRDHFTWLKRAAQIEEVCKQMSF